MNATKVTLFIVEDDPTFRLILTRHIGLKNIFTIYPFASGEECVDNLHLEPEIIILDYNLDRSGGIMDGKAVVSAIRQQHLKPKVVMLSGQDDGNLVLELIREGGIRDYVVKGTNSLDELDEILTQYLNQD